MIKLQRSNFQWWKDMLFPLMIFVGIVINVKFVIDQQTAAAQVFSGSEWFLWAWVTLLFVSTLATFIGTVLYRHGNENFLYFEYPGSVAAAFALFVYSGILLAHSPGISALGAAAVGTIGVHFLFNFLQIHRTYFSK